MLIFKHAVKFYACLRTRRSATVIRAAIPVILASVLVLAGCLRRYGRNADCSWPVESGAESASPGHLAADVELAEELSIRYMEVHAGPRDQKAAGVVKNRCLGMLLGEIGKQHRMSAAAVFSYFGHRNLAADFAMYLPFVLLYGFASDRMIRALQSRYPQGEGWGAIGVVVVLASVAFGAAGLVLGEWWSTMTEMVRLGTGHLSNRSFRLPIARHGMEVFGLAVLLFWGIAVVRYARGETNAR